MGGTGTALLAERLTATPRHDIDTGSSPLCGKGFFSQSRHSVPTLLRCPCSPHVQLPAGDSVHKLKILNTGSHTIV